MNQEFAIITDADLMDDAIADALIEAGCDDSTFFIRAGVSTLQFDREAATMAEAIASAIRDVEAGLSAAGSPSRVIRVDAEDLFPYAEEDLKAIAGANAGLSAARVMAP